MAKSFLSLLEIAENGLFMQSEWDDGACVHTELHFRFVERLDALKAGRFRAIPDAQLNRGELRVYLALTHHIVFDWTRDRQPFLRYVEKIDDAWVAEHYGYRLGTVRKYARDARAKVERTAAIRAGYRSDEGVA